MLESIMDEVTVMTLDAWADAETNEAVFPLRQILTRDRLSKAPVICSLLELMQHATGRINSSLLERFLGTFEKNRRPPL